MEFGEFPDWRTHRGLGEWHSQDGHGSSACPYVHFFHLAALDSYPFLNLPVLVSKMFP